VLDPWLGGVVGGVIVFVLTTITGVVMRTVQRGRELRGLSRVLWPEMKRNWTAIGVLKAGGFDPNTYQGEHPTERAWLDTRVKLSQLMRAHDFAILTKFYDELELLDTAVTRGDTMAQWYLPHERPAMKVVEGYCNARWRPFKGYGLGPLRAGGWGGSLLSPEPSGGSRHLPLPTPVEALRRPQSGRS
jgi:hypothetical protein